MAKRRILKLSSAEPWEQFQFEPPHQYARFLAYRDMDPIDRNIAQLARNLGVPYKSLYRVSTTWKWSIRVLEWDRLVARKLAAKRLKEIEKMNDRHAEAGLSLQGTGLTRLVGERDPKTGEVKGKLRLEDIDANAVTRMIEVGAKIERVARGEPDSITASKIDGRLETGPSEDRLADALARLARRLREDADPGVARPDPGGAEPAQLPMGDVGSTGTTPSEG